MIMAEIPFFGKMVFVLPKNTIFEKIILCEATIYSFS